ncbi:MAG: CRISPR-associated endonuclease Cas3'' [Magnetococcus sp. YQC-9]
MDCGIQLCCQQAPWGKTAGFERHHLAHHCADVAACFEGLVTQPVVRHRLERAAGRKLAARDLKRLAMLAFLHDAGKLHPGFQAKGWPEGVWRHAKTGHVAAGAAIFFSGTADWTIANNLHLQALSLWGVDEHLLGAVLAHHGRPFHLHEPLRHWPPASGYDPVAASREIGEVMSSWFATALVADGVLLPDTPGFQHLLCGLVTLADWLGSTQAIFDHQPELDPGAGGDRPGGHCVAGDWRRAERFRHCQWQDGSPPSGATTGRGVAAR